MKFTHYLSVTAILCSVAQPSVAQNVSVRDMTCAGWVMDHCPFWGYEGRVKANSEIGRNMAAALVFFAGYCKKEGFAKLNPLAVKFVKDAKSSNPKQFDEMSARFKREVPKAVLPKYKGETCTNTWTLPFQPGGVAAEAVGIESFYIYEDDEM
ncbi:hypothetical protein [Brucella sp. NBRC 12950]|uniref:hypothetical protein n=1 Tax=Brucella sp. NBRC 12950 TaxID=2994518 RepID=UPI002555CA1E|nr:hypothetical protein [Brucella sp. NBRC 12950]